MISKSLETLVSGKVRCRTITCDTTECHTGFHPADHGQKTHKQSFSPVTENYLVATSLGKTTGMSLTEQLCIRSTLQKISVENLSSVKRQCRSAQEIGMKVNDCVSS